MKKAKLVLSAMAIVATVGSAMAITKNLSIEYCTQNLQTAPFNCTITITGTTAGTGAVLYTGLGFQKLLPDQPCPIAACPDQTVTVREEQ